jgi:hypothetical protein
MYPAFATDQRTMNRPASVLGTTVWSCVAKQGGLLGKEPVLTSKPFAHRSGRSFGLSICAGASIGTVARLGNPEDRH